MAFLPTIDLVDCVIDEIALEGLDGITLEALWDRLALRLNEESGLSEKFMEQIWDVCLRVREIDFYELQEERDKLIIYDRYKTADPDLGIVREDDPPPDIYEHFPIDDWKNGIRGSCASYYTRKHISDIVRNLSLREAENIYKRKLVIVGSQAVRKNALMGQSVSPTLDFTVMQYCFLERVGRARYHGEVTQGKVSLGSLGEDPKLLFYYRKFLLKHKLVTKQTHHQKTGGHSGSGSLLHLTRFYVERKPKVITLAEKVVEILKKQKNYMADYVEMKKVLELGGCVKKVLKTSFLQKIIKTDSMVPWRALYPDAEPHEWQCKNNPEKEKTLRVMQLLDPKVDINDLWKEEFTVDDDEPYELDTSEQKYSVSFLKQANCIVEACREEGLDQANLAQKMGLPKLQSRTIFRSLAKMNIVATYMSDVARQRVAKYVSRKFEGESRMRKEFQHEVHKMNKLAQSQVEEKIDLHGDPVDEKTSKFVAEDEKKEEVSERTKNAENVPPEIFLPPPSTDSSHLFQASTKILRKYKLAGCKRNYKKTFLNVADIEDFVLRTKRRKLMKSTEKKDEFESHEEFNVPDTFTIQELRDKLLIGETDDRDNVSASDVIGLKNFANSDLGNVSNVTYRLLKRANIIMATVKEHKVIDGMTKLIKAITEEEEKEGYDVKIDKKSLVRLLQRLAKDNLVKNIKMTLSTMNRSKSLTFICDPSIDVNHTSIRLAVEQAKIKFCISGGQKVKTVLQSTGEKIVLPNESFDKIETVDKFNPSDKDSRTISRADLVYDRKAERRYGYVPKFRYEAIA